MFLCLVLCSCDTRIDGRSLYGTSREPNENYDIVIHEIAKQNPKIRELVHVPHFDYNSNIKESRIKCIPPEAVKQRSKVSYYVLLIVPGDFSLSAKNCTEKGDLSGWPLRIF